MRLPYMRIGGIQLFPSPILSYLQTDGSFYHRSKKSRVAFILATPRGKYEKVLDIQNASTSTETEWASIAYGLEYSLEKGERMLAIENDNLGVVSSLITRKKLRQDYAKHYRNEILTMAKQTEWTGIRWIPREQNHADKLF